MADEDKELWRAIGRMEQSLTDVRRIQDEHRQNYELGKARAIQGHEELLLEMHKGFKHFGEELSVVRAVAAGKMERQDFPVMATIENLWRERKLVIFLIVSLASALGLFTFKPDVLNWKKTEQTFEKVLPTPPMSLKEGKRK